MTDKDAPTGDLVDLAPSVSVLSECRRFHALSHDGARVAVRAYEHRVLVCELPGCSAMGEVQGLKTQFGEVHWTRDSSRLGSSPRR